MGYVAFDGTLWNKHHHLDLCPFSTLVSAPLSTRLSTPLSASTLTMTANNTFYRYAQVRLTLLVLLLCVGVINRADAVDPKPYPLTTCIVSGDKIDPNVQPIVHKNQQVRFCCKGCIKKFEACPDKFMVRLQGTDAGGGNKPKP